MVSFSLLGSEDLWPSPSFSNLSPPRTETMWLETRERKSYEWVREERDRGWAREGEDATRRERGGLEREEKGSRGNGRKIGPREREMQQGSGCKQA